MHKEALFLSECQERTCSFNIETTSMAKPGIPAEKPKRRKISDVPNPFPVKAPVRTSPKVPSTPQRAPEEPVPVGR